MKLLVLGAGGIGGYFGGRLAESGADVTFLVRPRRREQLDRDGLRIESVLGHVAQRVKTVAADELKRGYDFVLLTCKAYDLDAAMDAIAPAVTGGATVVPMLNGMAHMARLDERFGRASVMGGACFIGIALQPDGVIRHADTLQRIVFGERDRTKSARGQLFADAFAKTSVQWEFADDIEQTMWEKICMLTTMASITCLFRGRIGEIVAAPGALAAIERALTANYEIATREGHAPRPAAVEFTRGALTDPASVRTSSMLHDMEGGSATEADHIVGWMLEKARTHGIDDTILSLAYTHLKTYEIRRAADRLSQS